VTWKFGGLCMIFVLSTAVPNIIIML